MSNRMGEREGGGEERVRESHRERDIPTLMSNRMRERGGGEREREREERDLPTLMSDSMCRCPFLPEPSYVSIVSIRQYTLEYVNVCQHTHVRQYVSMSLRA